MLNDEIKLDLLQRGTRITTGEEGCADASSDQRLVEIAIGRGFMEVELPSIEARSLYVDKAGEEIVNRQMYTFQDKGERDVCLRPEGTATCQLIAQKYRYDKDIKLFYVARCWRYERPQEGRYREFTQFGIEVLNPSLDYSEELRTISREMIEASGLKPDVDYVLNDGVKRGLAYYTDGMGWEAEVPSLGAQKQVLGGGPYAEGIGLRSVWIASFLR